MTIDKNIIIEFVDEDFSKQLEEQEQGKFISALISSELKYNVENIERYAKYLNEKLEFPFIGYYSVDNGMFGNERIKIKIEKLENELKKGIKCVYKYSGNLTRKIPLYMIDIEEKNENKNIINQFKNWYDKNQRKRDK